MVRGISGGQKKRVTTGVVPCLFLQWLYATLQISKPSSRSGAVPQGLGTSGARSPLQVKRLPCPTVLMDRCQL